MNKTTLLFLAASASLLAACGGRSDNPAPAPNPLAAVPDSATQSAAGLTTYLNALSTAQGADQAEPIDVSAITLPQPDNTEPEPV